MPFLERSFFDNTILEWIIATSIVVAFLIIIKIIEVIVVRRLERFAQRSESEIDDMIAATLRKTWKFLVFIIALAVGSFYLTLPAKVAYVIHVVATVAVALQIALWLNTFIGQFLGRLHAKRKAEDPASVSVFGAVTFFVRLVLWTIIFFLVLDNLGIDITTLVAGLGIGGIAIALAAQNILGDIFNSVVILVDKPFEVGDFIIVGSEMGVVEKIGIKTTRVRSLFGEQIVFTNSDLISSRIKNYKRMQERRITFQIGVTYQTPADKLEKIPAMIREVISSIDKTRFDRSHFKNYGDFSLNFETVYYVLSGDYNLFMDIQQTINLALYRKFDAEKIVFAYPTQTLFVDDKVRVINLSGDGNSE